MTNIYLSPRMFRNNPFEVLEIEVRIDLSRGDIGMSQHGLNASQIRSPFNEMSCKRVT